MTDKLFQIRHRYADKVIFELKRESLSGANLSGANLSGADLRGADLRGADLSRADLYGANLFEVNLSGAYLRDADLRDADLRGADGEKTTIEKTPVQIIGLDWPIIIFDNDMRIGCEYHSLADWWNFSDEQIEKMADQAYNFWYRYKKSLQRICAVTGRVCE